ncbi:hypothetical protein BHE74_00056777 [Ensete ventricosum]|uniref:Uncharacterized protein n=1 Tax=Ensete ventricosum TaxID=4639 RepID=A0A445MJ72_ENSVE|nr:hypothetical protein BHE74_00056777 [Ensete ventricosum]RZR74295.1 hypothetical protein BHM03_00034944 [Ensete ventricosum]
MHHHHYLTVLVDRLRDIGALTVQELEQRLAEVHREVESRFIELDLELNLALCRVDEAKEWAEETHDEVAIAEDMTVENAMESKQKIETLCRELKAH